jgi:hypothetical protein
MLFHLGYLLFTVFNWFTAHCTFRTFEELVLLTSFVPALDRQRFAAGIAFPNTDECLGLAEWACRRQGPSAR